MGNYKGQCDDLVDNIVPCTVLKGVGDSESTI